MKTRTVLLGWVAAISAAVCLCPDSSYGVELIVNGTFEGGSVPVGLSNPLDGAADTLPNGWSRVESFSGGVLETSMLGPFVPNGPSLPGLVGMEFVRWQGDNASGDWTAIQQPLNIQAVKFSSLKLSLDVQVLMENLVAGGWVAPAFEWPAVVQIDYTDTGGKAQTWRFGWYLNPPGDGPPGPINDPGQGLIPFYNDLLVQALVWVPNTFDLFAQLPQVGTITNIRAGGSGWHFQSFVDNVSLQGEPIPEPASVTLLALGLLALSRRRRRA